MITEEEIEALLDGIGEHVMLPSMRVVAMAMISVALLPYDLARCLLSR